MKQSTYKILNLAILLFSSLLVLNAANIDEDYSKVIEKSFNISKDGIVMLKNKFGNMNVKTWSDNKVDIRVSIEVDVKDEAKAKKIFEAINIAFENKADFVSAVTEFNTKDLKLKKDEKLSINYDVSMPASCFLDATNKYGNLVTESLDNGAHISVSYGSARADEIGGDLELKLAYASKAKFEGMADLDAVLKYSEVEIEAMQNGTIVSKYSKVKVEEAGVLKIESKYDDYEIEKASSLENEGKYDHFSFDELGTVKMETAYTDLNIDELKNSAGIELKYGKIEIGDIQKGFTNVNIEAEFADIKLATDADCMVSLDATHGAISVPDDLKENAKIEKEDHKTKVLNGKMGSGSSSASIQVAIKFGAIKLED